MKRTGISRHLDRLGRIVIPKEICRTLGIADRDKLEFFVESDCVILRKVDRTCVFCDTSDDITHHKNRAVCQACIKQLTKADRSSR